MRILMMTNTYLPVVGGLENSIESLTGQLRSLGHEVLIAVPQWGDSKSAGNDFTAAVPLPGQILKLVRSFRPDVIHAHHPFLMGEAAVRVSVQSSKPLVYTHHIRFDQYGHYLPLPTSPAAVFLTELAVGFANLASRVIAPSESIRDILIQEGVKTPVDVAPSGVAVHRFGKGNRKKWRKRLGIPEKAVVLGYAGRLAKEKNLEFLTNAILNFIRKKDAYFVVAGSGPMEEFLRKTFEEAHLGDRLHLAGVLRGADLSDCYQAMDVFAFASKSETQGLVLCEAMAAGLPVVAIDSPGVREVVKDCENGRLLAEEDSEAFSEALGWCVDLAPDNRRKIKRNAKKTAGLFSVEHCALRTLEVYERACFCGAVLQEDLEKSKWHKAAQRLKTEWQLFLNLGHATGCALREEIKSHAG